MTYKLLFRLCLLIFMSAHAVSRSQSVEKPNIILIMAEDIGIDLACYGMDGVATPNLDQLARQGVLYEKVYCTNPICSPNRSAMMVGTHQNVIGAHHHRSMREVPLSDPYLPFTYWLRQAGYTCILGSEWVQGNGRKLDVNFQHEVLGTYDGETQFGLFDTYDTVTQADQPFFQQIQLQVTHRGDWWDEIRDLSKDPVDPAEVVLPPYLPEDSIIRLDWAKYLDQMEYMDKEVGLIIKDLKEKNLADNTIIIFIGDNGRCNVRGKGYLYDPGIHIPLIIFDPQTNNPGERSERLISTTDITASIIQLASGQAPDYLTGIPFIRINNPPEREIVYSARDIWDEVYEQSRAITTTRYRYIRNHYIPQAHDAHQAYLEFYRPAIHRMREMRLANQLTPIQEMWFAPVKPKEELFDLTVDPHELTNLALDTTYQDLLVDMRAKMDQWVNQNEDVGLSEPVPWQHIVTPGAVFILDWVKHTKPELYQQMQAGVEIGFQRLAREYRTAMEDH